ncbi:hypothetical protein C8J56DRAFT_1031757 [Mycena floridula]|nr:hypothetical protein C8J56DRAFT_1031757 [Mycena floridula]
MICFKGFALNALIVIFLLPTILATPSESNAQRFRRGLGPLPPRRFGRSIPGYSQPPPTRVVAARSSSSPSSTPSLTQFGRLQVRTSDNVPLGYVRNTGEDTTIGGINFLGDDHDLHVKITTSGRGQASKIIATNAVFPPPFYLGVISESGVGLNNSNSLAFSNVNNVQDPHEQSSIWFFDHATKEVSAQYVNPDGAKPSTILAYDTRENHLFFVGHLASYNSHTSFPASAVASYPIYSNTIAAKPFFFAETLPR